MILGTLVIFLLISRSVCSVYLEMRQCGGPISALSKNVLVFRVKGSPPTLVQLEVNVLFPFLQAVHPNTTAMFTLIDFRPTYFRTVRYETLIVRNISATSAPFVVLAEIDNSLLVFIFYFLVLILVLIFLQDKCIIRINEQVVLIINKTSFLAHHFGFYGLESNVISREGKGDICIYSN